jgi:PAS domain S-box-containing protein
MGRVSIMLQLKDIMTPVEKCLLPSHSLRNAIELMKDTRWPILPVTDEEGKLAGVFTRSHLFQMLLEEKPLETPIEAYMRTNAVALPTDTPYDVIEKYVFHSRVGTGIVFDREEKVVGVFTKADMIMTLFRSTHSLKEQLQAILRTSQLGAVMTDQNLVITYTNEKFVRMLHHNPTEIIGSNLTELIPISLDAEGVEWQSHITVGQHRTIARASTYKKETGEVGYILLFQEVSDVEHLAEELQTVKMWKGLFESVIDHAYDGIVMINESAKVTFINPPLLELFGLEMEASLHKSIDKLLPQLELSKMLKIGVADTSPIKEEYGIKYIVHRIPIVSDGQIVGAIGKVMFRQLHEVQEQLKRMERSTQQISNAHPNKSSAISSRFTLDTIITQDEQMDKLKKSAVQAAKGKSTILIRGESGTGKELFAQGIHQESNREMGPFVTVNCAAIPEHLLESEFFGYEEGAFTGAKQKGKLGKFDLANGGTLFLDEIGDMSLQLQTKMLRVIQEREYYRVGGTECIQVDVRIIAATNRALEEMVENRSFREDLFYRLNVISFVIPPLRKRETDIPLLTKYFLRELNQSLGTSVTGVEQEVEEALLHHNWRGNVRELRNVLERGATFAQHGKITLNDLPDYLLKKLEHQSKGVMNSDNLVIRAGGTDHGSTTAKQLDLKSIEQEAIRKALIENKGNKSKAARELGISRTVLYEKIKKYGI